MIYLICKDWYNTSNNHAGIKYLCNKLQELYPEHYRSFVIPSFIDGKILSTNRLIAKLQYKYASYQHNIFCNHLYLELKSQIKPGDVIFLTEYLEKSSPLYNVATAIKAQCPQIRLWAMVHLIPKRLEQDFPTDKELKKWISPIEKVYTLGHSLSDYLISRGLNKEKVSTTFHYVDDFYITNKIKKSDTCIKVIAMGNQVRNLSLLKQVVSENELVDFTICQGVMDLSDMFKNFPNVHLIPFVPEPDLKRYMTEADISLNVMEDTIGSNVIVTSLGMGLALICSNVGSIHDYCDATNCIFCSNDSPSEITAAIAKLSQNKEILLNMKMSANKRAKELRIEKFHQDLIQNLVSL